MRARRVVPVILTVALALPCAARADAQPRREKVVIAILPETNIFRQKARFRLLGEYLGRKIGVPVQFTIVSRYGNILERLDAAGVDGAFLGSFTGALAIERLGVVPLARPVNLDGSSSYRGRLFVRRDSGIRTVADLRGKRMAFVERATTAGYVFPLAWLRASGVQAAERWFAEAYFTGSHDAAVRAVLDRQADVGVAKDSVYEAVRRADPRVDAELAILAVSPAVPSNGLCVRRDLEADLREAFRRALLELDRDPDGARVLAQFGALRFVEASAADYRPVLELARDAGIDLARYEYRNQ